MKTEDKGSVKYVHQSQKNYYVCYENMFIVLPDGKTIFGEEYGNSSMLISEDISKNESDACIEVDKRGKTICTLFYDEVSESLFAGGWDEKLGQYKKSKDSQSWTMVKDYGNMGIGWIYSVAQIGNLLIFGGNHTKLIAIDGVNQRQLEGGVDTAIGLVFSLQVCELPDEEMYLSVNGENISYSDDKTDLFDATDLARTFGHNFGTLSEKKHDKKNSIIKEDHQDHPKSQPTDEEDTTIKETK
jgi:hypothetical protein